MGINIMENGVIIVEMDGEYIRINRQVTNMLEIGNKIKRMDLVNK